MPKKVILKRTEQRDGDAVLDCSENPDPFIVGKNSDTTVRYICPDCRKVQIKDMTIEQVQERMRVERHPTLSNRLLLKCSCGAHLVLNASAPRS